MRGEVRHSQALISRTYVLNTGHLQTPSPLHRDGEAGAPWATARAVGSRVRVLRSLIRQTHELIWYTDVRNRESGIGDQE